MPIEFNNDDDENNSTNNPFVPKIDKKDSTIDQDNNIESTSIKKSTE